jgi:flavin-dependent dehydrogenase
MNDHIEEYQLPKHGLRFFFKRGGNLAIEERGEFGQHGYYADSTAGYTAQLDRGRFENALAEKAKTLGVEFIDGASVRRVDFGELHTVHVDRGGVSVSLSARWVVDASSRGSIIKRKLGLQKEAPHNVNAAWWRHKTEIDIQTWSTNTHWQARMTTAIRRLATNHLLGPGYWVWVIPLGSGSTSVGIVADEALHPFDTINRFEKAVEWLRRNEPQCAKVVEKNADNLQDFKVLKHFAHGCKQVYSAEDRWCLTGEAGVFLDPFYSPGSDFIAISNTFTTEIVTRALDGTDMREDAKYYNDFFLRLFEHTLEIYQDQYPVMGTFRPMVAKLAWDSLFYVGTRLLLVAQRKLTNIPFLRSIEGNLERFMALESRMQRLFIDWGQLDTTEQGRIFFPLELMEPVGEVMGDRLPGRLDDDTVRGYLRDNLLLLEKIAVFFFFEATKQLPRPPARCAINPYKIGLDPTSWAKEGLFDAREPLVDDSDVADLLHPFFRGQKDMPHAVVTEPKAPGARPKETRL